MYDDAFQRNSSGELELRTVNSTGDTGTNKDDVLTRDSQGRLCVRTTGGGGGGGGSTTAANVSVDPAGFTKINATNAQTAFQEIDSKFVNNIAAGGESTSVVIGNVATPNPSFNSHTILGTNVQIQDGYGVAVGFGTFVNYGGVAVGTNARAQSYGVAIGMGADATFFAIQLGAGVNSEEKTMNVGLDPDDPTKNFKLLKSDGTIPTERLPQTNYGLKISDTFTQAVNDSETYNLITTVDLSTDVTLAANMDASNYSVADGALKLPTNAGYVDYGIEVRLSGTFAGGENTNREFSIQLQRADGTIISEKAVIKLTGDELSKRGVVFETFTNTATDPFIASGLKLVINNTSGQTLNLTGCDILIKARA